MKVALRPALQDKKFSPAYYLHGEDEFLKEEALRALVDAAIDPATRDFNLDQRRGGDLDAESLASLLNMPPMMAERRVVVIRDVPALKKEPRDALERYLRSPATDVLVVVTAPADAKVDKTLSGLAVPVECDQLTGVQVPKWIVARADKACGTTITPAAVELLQDAVGSDLGQLAIELDKLSSYCGGRPIDEDAVAAVVGVRRDETLGHLLDAVAMRDGKLALSLISGVLQQPKITSVFAVMTLTTQMLALAIGKSRGAKSTYDYINILKSGSSNLPGRAWGEAAATWTRATAQWSTAELDHALAVLYQTDFALKNSRVSSDEQVLATAVMDICGGASVRNAA